jgi:hypothetical protein
MTQSTISLKTAQNGGHIFIKTMDGVLRLFQFPFSLGMIPTASFILTIVAVDFVEKED